MPGDRGHGFSGVFPHRAGFHQLGQKPRGAGGAGAGVGSGVAGGVQPWDHGPGSAALRPAVRAVPESRAGIHAGLRRGFLPGQPRAGDRIREGEVRARRGEPDCHLRHARRQGGGARRRPRPGDALQRLRQPVEDDPLQSHRSLDARSHAGKRAGLQGALRQRRGDPQSHRPGAAARRPDAQHRHACGGRHHCAGQAHGFLPAVLPARQRDQCGVPVRQGGRGRRRAGEVRLPGLAQPDHSGLGGALRARVQSGQARLQSDEPAAGRCRDLRVVVLGQYHGGFPARRPGHERAPEEHAAQRVRGPDRLARAVPPGSAGIRHGGGFRQPQARPGQGRLFPSGSGAGAQEYLRGHRLPGTGDADLADHRRLFAGRRGSAAARHGQEEARVHGQAARHLPGGRRQEGL
ncbi:hypothetical protein CDEF62S_00993 [Castellaniella defragrans]